MAKVCLYCNHRYCKDDWCCPNCEKRPSSAMGFIAFAPELAQKNNHFEASLFAGLADIEPGHFWFEARNRLLLYVLRRHFPDVRSFLEIGCGTGFVLSALQKAMPTTKWVGTDLFTEGLTFASDRVPEATFFQMDARRIPFVNEFDVIGAFDVLEHIEEDELVLSQMSQAVRPGGGIALTVPQHQFLWSTVDHRSHHKRRYSRRDLVKKVERAGFKVVKVTSFVSLLLPLMLFVRSRKKIETAEFDLLAEFKISPYFNNLLEQIMSIERNLIKKGLSLPVGGSLLLVAKDED